jgi:hypothetical protein
VGNYHPRRRAAPNKTHADMTRTPRSTNASTIGRTSSARRTAAITDRIGDSMRR